LALDDKEGEIRALPQLSIETAIAAAELVELTFLRKLDVTPTLIYMVDRSPLHLADKLTDEVLNLLITEPQDRPIAYWLNAITEHIPHLQSRVLESLVAKKVLKVEQQKILWVFNKRRYPVQDDREIVEVKQRLRQIIESGEIPEPRDMVLISLTRACRLFLAVFSPEERERYLPQIDKIAGLDFVGQALSKTLREMEQSVCTMNEMIYRYT
jgi:hypothetical protein